MKTGKKCKKCNGKLHIVTIIIEIWEDDFSDMKALIEYWCEKCDEYREEPISKVEVKEKIEY